MNLTYAIVLVKEGEKWWSYIPDLPGVYGIGDTSAHATEDIREALALYLDEIREEGRELPVSRIMSVDTGFVTIAA
jgi:predicted RNase H-like HicB family nuclease